MTTASSDENTELCPDANVACTSENTTEGASAASASENPSQALLDDTTPTPTTCEKETSSSPQNNTTTRRSSQRQHHYLTEEETQTRSVTHELSPETPCKQDDTSLLDAERKFLHRHHSMAHAGPPYGKIALSVVITLIGVTLITFAVFLFTDVFAQTQDYRLTPYGLVIFGIMCLIPGLYHIQFACRACAGQRGISWDDFPGS